MRVLSTCIHIITSTRASLVIFFIIPFLVTAQVDLPMNLKAFPMNTSNGFESRVVTGVVQDKSGFTWIGTSDGLYRYDGYGFRHYMKSEEDSNSLWDNNITRIALGNDQKIWMGFNKGAVCSYDPSTGQFNKYLLTGEGRKWTGGEVTFLYVDKSNRIWVGIRQHGFIALDIQKGAHQYYDIIPENDPSFSGEIRKRYNTVNASVEDANGNLWLATHNGLYHFDVHKKKLQAFREPINTKTGFRNDNYICIEKDADHLWLGAWGGGLARYHIATGTWKHFKMNSAEPEKYTTNIVSSIKERSDRSLWITSNDKGVGIFNKNEESFEFYSKEEAEHMGVPSNLCYGIFKNRNGSLWLTHEWGLTRIEIPTDLFSFHSVKVSRTDNLEYYYIKDIAEDNFNRYIATEFADGLHIENKRTGITKVLRVGILPGEEPFQAIHRVYIDSKQRVWIISRDLIYLYDTQKEKLVLIEQPPNYSTQNRSNEFTDCVEDKHGRIWITSSRNGVFCYDPIQKKYQHYKHIAGNQQTLSSSTLVTVAMDDQGRIWVGGKNCLAYFNEADNRFENFTVTTTKRKVYTENNIYTLFANAKGALWIGADIGLLKLDTKTPKKALAKLYDAAHGLRGGIVQDITMDIAGRIWVATPSALCMLNTTTGNIKAYSLQRDVLKSISGKIKLATYGKLVRVLTYGGYYETDGNSDIQTDSSLPLKITSFRVGDKEYFYEAQLKREGKIKLLPGEQMFSFEFGIPDHKSGTAERYDFMLEGFDKSWVHSDGRRYASYTNIRSGNYVFKVRAITADGSEVKEIAIPLRVVAPFYLRWWFLTLLAVIAIVLSYEWYAYRLRKQRQILVLQTRAQALEKEKTLVQYENLKQHLNPHFLFNSLTSLGSLIRVDQKMAASFLDGMSKIYRYILQSKDAETVLLKDEIGFVQTFIRLQEARFGKGLDIRIKVNEDQLYRKIVPVTLQNLIENAIKHNIVDEETPLVIDIFTEEEYLIVRNNLQRKNFVETSNRQGLQNLVSLYNYLTEKQLTFTEDDGYFMVKIPLI